MGFLMACPVRVFDSDQRDKAVEWLETLPGNLGVAHHLIPASQVMIVEVGGPLRSEDFEALTATANEWLDKHHELRGLVIHARQFPGWEDLGGFLGHVRFVRDYHRKIARVALAVDGKLAELAPRFAEHFVEAEIKEFGHDELRRAVAWASKGQADAQGARAQSEHGPRPMTG
jgi:hypothetical protein